MSEPLDDAYDNIIFQQIEKGDSVEVERQKSRDNAVAAIACELHKIRKLMEVLRDTGRPKWLMSEQGKPDEILAEEKKNDSVPMSSQLFIKLVFGEDATIAGIKQSLAAMDHLVVLTMVPGGNPVYLARDNDGDWVASFTYPHGIGRTAKSKLLPDAILNLKVEK